MQRLILALAFGTLFALPVAAQQPGSEPNVFENIGGTVRGIFKRIFGGGESKPAEAAPAQSPKPAPEAEQRSAQPGDAPAQSTLPAPAAAFKESPIPRTADIGLHQAIARDDYESALKMIEQGADIEAKDPEAGGSVLHFAVMKGKLPVIDLLVTRGADINSRTKNGTTPLHTAVLYGWLPVVEYLVDRGADVNAQSASGTTPLRLAIAAKNEPIAARLRKLGAR